MKQNPFKATFIFGLTIFLVPIFLVSLFLFINFVGKSKQEVKETPKKEVIVETKKVIVYDTVIIEQPKPKIKKEPVVEVQRDTEQITDTLNH
jgi:hydrogenase-4 membrane subunit HyfE